MRPRVAFSVLLAIGAAMHIALLTTRPGSLAPIATYSGWLLLSGAVAITFWVRNQRADAELDKRRLLRGEKVPRMRIEGLGWFAVAAAAGFVMHVLNTFSSSGKYSHHQGITLVFFILAASSSAQLRGPVGDADAPVPDDSPLSRAGSLLRRLVGLTIACVGVGLIYSGIASSGDSTDGLRRVISWFFKAGGVVFALIGLALALLPRRDDA